MPSWVQAGFSEYQKRLSHAFSFELKEIPAQKRSKSSDLARILTQEGEALLAAIPKDDICVVLDVAGQGWSTETLAVQLQKWQHSGQNISLVIGGPEGLSAHVYQRANLRWSLSKLTFPHPLVRVIIAEQLYRAWSILSHHPYHRGE